MSGTTNYIGGLDTSSSENIKFDFNSVIIGQNSGDKLYTSSSTNNNLNVFIGINSGINADNISKTILIGENSGYNLNNSKENILIGKYNNNIINKIENTNIIGNNNNISDSNIYYTNIYGIGNNININYKNNIYGNYNLINNTSNSLIIGNSNNIINTNLYNNYIYIGNNLHDNNEIITNIDNILLKNIDNSILIGNENKVGIGYQNNDINNSIFNNDNYLYIKNGLTTSNITFNNSDNKSLVLKANNNLLSNIEYVLPNNINNYNINSNYFLSVNDINELYWYENTVPNDFLNTSNYIRRLEYITERFSIFDEETLELNNDFNIKGILTVEKLNISGGTVYLTHDDIDHFQGPQGLRGLKGDKGDRGLQGIQGETGPSGNGISDISYNNIMGTLTFTTDNGNNFTTEDIRGRDGDGITSIFYNPQNNSLIINGTKEYLNLVTGSLKGNTGDTGPQGPTGPQGLKGDNMSEIIFKDTSNNILAQIGDDTYGSIDIVVPQGLKGEKGDKGDKGDRGPRGFSLTAGKNIVIDDNDIISVDFNDIENSLSIISTNNSNIDIRLNNLPTSEPQESGRLWNDNGFLRIKS